MRMPSLTSPATLIGLAAGGALLGLAVTSLAGGDFKVESGWRAWQLSKADAIRKLLGSAHLQAIDPTGAPNTYRVLPGRGPGASALDEVRAMQRRGSLVVSTTNLLDSGDAPRGVSEVPAADTGALQFGDEKDGIAALPIGI